MIIVDTHCHASNNWFEPVELLLFQMNRNDVDKGVLIQHRGTFDAGYLLECANRFPGRFSVVVIVDVNADDALTNLDKWSASGASGVRLGPTVRSPGSDPLAIWKKIEELGLVVSFQGTPVEFASDECKELVERFPSIPIVIEHLAGANAGIEAPYAEFKSALELSAFPNTYIKVPGLGEISTRPDVLTAEFRFDFTPPLLELVLDAFGPRRMMWGSDYPPVSNREGYRNALQGVLTYPAFSGGDAIEWIAGRTALSVFKLE